MSVMYCTCRMKLPGKAMTKCVHLSATAATGRVLVRPGCRVKASECTSVPAMNGLDKTPFEPCIPCQQYHTLIIDDDNSDLGLPLPVWYVSLRALDLRALITMIA